MARANIEQLLVTYLGGLHAEHVGKQVVAGDCIQVRRIGGSRDNPGHIDRPRVQLDCRASTNSDAHDLAVLVAAELTAIPQNHAAGIVSNAVEESFLDFPDVVGNAERPRYVVEFTFVTRPTP